MEAQLHADQARRSPKRPLEMSRAFYPRKRSLMACEVCRRKKSKCDNAKPTCGSCQRLGIECIFRDSKSDHSTYDLASQEILEQISQVMVILETQTAQLSGLLAAQQYSFSPPLSYDAPRKDADVPINAVSLAPGDAHHLQGPQSEAALLSESLEFAETNTGKCEDLLEWPIFEGMYHRSETETLIFNPDLARDDKQAGLGWPAESHRDRRSMVRRGIQEEDVMPLIRRFLANVHIKNPVVNIDDITKMAKDVIEHGFKWDAQSCLVLIASALGCLSSPYISEYITTEQVQGNSVDEVEDYSTAESYYIAAQKRIGLLTHTILASQCCFLSGVYEMYSLRPLKAWYSFNRSCLMLQIYHKTKPKTTDTINERLERRLYWSCLKSECEIRMEISLPPSGLGRMPYPDVFPTPPSGSPGPAESSAERTTNNQPEGSLSMSSIQLEKSWGYYLSDIAVRRIANRLVNTFYQDDASSWLSIPIERMIRVAEELELQLTQWHSHIPKLVTTPDPAYPSIESEELRSLLQLRLLEFRERIYRPFLYRAIHEPTTSPARRIIEPYAQRCLDACMQNTLRGSHRHRHHGTWYQNRKIFAESLLILAAAKSRRVDLPPVWRDAINTVIAGLRFWETEAPDLRGARTILQTIMDDIDEGMLVTPDAASSA